MNAIRPLATLTDSEVREQARHSAYSLESRSNSFTGAQAEIFDEEYSACLVEIELLQGVEA